MITNLVTGGAGFIGSNLIDYLIKQNENVICLDNLSTGNIENINHHFNNSNFEFVQADICDQNEFTMPINKIWNLACPASPTYYQRDPLKTLKICFQGTFNVLNLAKIKKSKFLFASSSEIYSNPISFPQYEKRFITSDLFSSRSCYSEGKRVAETLCFNFHKINNIDIKIARIFNAYGPRLKKDDGRVISNFINQALNKEDLTIYGNGAQTRSFCYIDDIVQGLITFMNSKENGPINFGYPRDISIKDLALLIKEKINPLVSLVYKEALLDDPIKRIPSIDKAKKLLDWYPNINLSEGIEYTINYFENLTKTN